MDSLQLANYQDHTNPNLIKSRFVQSFVIKKAFGQKLKSRTFSSWLFSVESPLVSVQAQAMMESKTDQSTPIISSHKCDNLFVKKLSIKEVLQYLMSQNLIRLLS